jgi:SPP1 family predicted phage head-tail adaptor
VRAGELRKRFIHYSYTSTRNTVGQEVRTYTEVQALWGGLEDLSGGEGAYYKAISPEVTSVLTVRKSPSLVIKPSDRLIHDGVTYEVVSSIDKEGRNRETVLGVKRVPQT